MDLCEEITAERKDVVVVGWEDTAKDTAIGYHDGRQAQANCPKQVGVSCVCPCVGLRVPAHYRPSGQ
jgi:hypothetical protein